jgi:hypothetical protein
MRAAHYAGTETLARFMREKSSIDGKQWLKCRNFSGISSGDGARSPMNSRHWLTDVIYLCSNFPIRR